MQPRWIAHYVFGALNLIWFLAALSGVLLALLVLWSVVAAPPTLTSAALEISLAGFHFHQPSSDPAQNLVIALPVALKPGASADRTPMTGLQGEYRFPIQKGAFLTVSLIILTVSMTLALGIIDQLWRVFKTLKDRDPFAAENANRIRRIGWGVILLELVHSGAILYWSNSVAPFAAAGVTFEPSSRISAPAILYGMLILALAEVFREGARLKEEQSLTI